MNDMESERRQFLRNGIRRKPLALKDHNSVRGPTKKDLMLDSKSTNKKTVTETQLSIKRHKATSPEEIRKISSEAPSMKNSSPLNISSRSMTMNNSKDYKFKMMDISSGDEIESIDCDFSFDSGSLQDTSTSVYETPYKGPPLDHDDELSGYNLSSPSSQVSQFIHQQRIKSSENKTRAKRNLYSPNQSKVYSHPSSEEEPQCDSRSHLNEDVTLNAGNCNRSFFIEMKPEPKVEKVNSSTDSPLKVIIGNFAESRWLDFEDRNIVGQTRSIPFDLVLPDSSNMPHMVVDIEKVPHKKGFSLSNEADDKVTSVHLIKGKSTRLKVSWTPVQPGGTREVIHLKFPRGRVQVIVHGHAKEQPKKRIAGKAKKLDLAEEAASETTYHTPISKMHAVSTNAVSKHLSYSSSTDHSVPKSKRKLNMTLFEAKLSRPMSKLTFSDEFVADSIDTETPKRSWHVYNDDFAEKQCEAYTQWLNYIFQNPDHLYDEEQHQREEAGIPDEIDRPTLRALLIHRRRAQATLKAVQFYNCHIMHSVRKAIFHEVQFDRISIRSDQDVLSNTMLRSQLLNLLMSYSTPWLQLGLEVIFGEVISNTKSGKPLSPMKSKCSSPSSVSEQHKPSSIRMVLRKFIKERILSDPQLLLKYTGGKCKMPSGRFEKMYKIELRRHTLGIILTLVSFLDSAKEVDLIESSPLLFIRSGIIKSSKEFLDILCRDYIHGIGNLHKHMSQIGIHLNHKQTHRDEIEFHVENIATDLRDGVRLGKLAELLDNSISVMERLRLPAGSRLQKVHNVKVALSAFSSLGIPYIENIHPNYIVDSHRPQVLTMLWYIMHTFQLPKILDIEKLVNEINAIQRTKKFASKIINYVPSHHDCSKCEDVCDVLLIWCQVVCACYNTQINNFSTDFACGRVFCILIHHYHPGIISKSEILQNRVNSSTHIDNKKYNLILAISKMIDIGGIPNMLSSTISDSESIPDERTIIMTLAYLCARLLESSTEIRAAKVIQHAYERYKDARLLRKMESAVIVIERAWVQHKSQYYCNRKAKFLSSVQKIESFFISFRENLLKIKLRRLAAIQIQKIIRRSIAKQNFKSLLTLSTSSAIIIQSFWRCKRDYVNYRRVLKSLVVIQSVVRMKQAKNLLFSMIRAVISIQSVARRWLSYKTFLFRLKKVKWDFLLIAATVSCQARVRRNVSRRIYLRNRKAAILIQSIIRRALVRSHLMNMNSAASHEEILNSGLCTEVAQSMVIPSHSVNSAADDFHLEYEADQHNRYRRPVLSLATAQINRDDTENSSISLSQQVLFNRHRCATLIQKIWRGFSQYHQFRFDLSDIVFVQSLVRRRLSLNHFQKMRSRALVVQSFWRGCIVRMSIFVQQSQTVLVCDDAATTIQKYWRGYQASTNYTLLLDATFTLQSFFRNLVERKRFTKKVSYTSVSSSGSEPTLSPRNPSLVCSHKSHSTGLLSDTPSMFDSLSELVSADLRVELRQRAAIAIQRRWRGSCSYVDYLIVLDAIRCIQNFYRSHVKSKLMLDKGNAYLVSSDSTLLTPPLLPSDRGKELEGILCSVNLIGDINTNSMPSRDVIHSDRNFGSILSSLHSDADTGGGHYNFRNSYSNFVATDEIFMNDSKSDREAPLNNQQKAATTLHQEQLSNDDGRNSRRVWDISEHFCSSYDSSCDKSFFRSKVLKTLDNNSIAKHLGSSFNDRGTLRSNLVSRDSPVSMIKQIEASYVNPSDNQSKKDDGFGDASITITQNYALHKNVKRDSKLLRSRTKKLQHRISQSGQETPSTLEDQIKQAEEIGLLQKARIELKARRTQTMPRLEFSSNKEWSLPSSPPNDVRTDLRMSSNEVSEKQLKAEPDSILSPGSIDSIESQNASKYISNPLHKLTRSSVSVTDDKEFAATAPWLLSLTDGESSQSDFASSFSHSIDTELLTKNESYPIHQQNCDFVNRFPNKLHEIFFEKNAEKEESKIQDVAPQRQSYANNGRYKAVIIQRYWRGFYCRDKYEAIRWGIILLQSHFRGFRTREFYRRVASKISTTSYIVPCSQQLAIGPRTTAALQLLKNSKSLTDMSCSIKTLEMSTRYSRVCCAAVVSKGTPAYLFRILQYCNRSRPHVDILTNVLRTLDNISKHEDLVPFVITVKAIDILLDSIQMFRDKSHILNLTSSLLHTFVCTEHSALLECSRRENMKRINGVVTLIKKSHSEGRKDAKTNLALQSLEKVLNTIKLALV